MGQSRDGESSMHIVILSGGGGTRLWPLSRQDFPKQFLRFGDEKTLLQKSVERFLHFPHTRTVTVSTNAQYAPLVKQQLSKIELHRKIDILIEPERKNTAPAISFAIKHLEEKTGIGKEEPILVLPSDHFMEPETILCHYLEQMAPLIQKGKLILFGIIPTKPETGYGYIELGKKCDDATYRVKRFVEKPNLSLAKSYLASSNYYWNSGMFAFSASCFWQNLHQHAPEIARLSNGTLEEMASAFHLMPDISFDYAVLEKCKETFVCPLPVDWSDIGCWDSVYDVMAKDENQNVKYGNVVAIDTKNSLIIGGKRLISTIGLSNLLIVETDDATFISKRGESQKVKEMVQELVQIGRKEGANHIAKRFPWGILEPLEEKSDYSIQKIQIDPNQSWQMATLSKGTLTLLNGEPLCQIDGKTIALKPYQFVPIEQGQQLLLENRDKNPLELLLLIAKTK